MFKGSIEMEPGRAHGASNKGSSKITQNNEGADLKVSQ